MSKTDRDLVMELSLERCGWETSVWINGEPLGSRESLVSPHLYDLSAVARAGTNRLTIMVDHSNLKRHSAGATTDMAEDEELVMVGCYSLIPGDGPRWDVASARADRSDDRLVDR